MPHVIMYQPPHLPGTASLVSLSDLAVDREGQRVLSSVNLTVGPGEIVTIVGPNGSGKSTLLQAIVGVVRPDSGRIEHAPGLRIGYVPQRLHADPTLPMTVWRFLSLPFGATADRKLEVLDQTGAAGLQHRQLTRLSGGQLQRVMLARALLADPNLLILDEPTQGLDQAGSAAFYRLIEDLRQRYGCAVLMVSHELHVVMSTSDRVICLNGHVCCEGTPEVVSNAPEYRALFGSQTQGALALYRHEHNHSHDHPA